MTGYNLPPGVSVTDIPGNRPEDLKWCKALEDAADRIDAGQIVADDVREAIGELSEEDVMTLAKNPLVREMLIELRAQELIE